MSNKAKFKSSINSRLGNRTAFDRIRSLLDEVKKRSNEEDSGGSFYGISLYTNKLTIRKFKEIFQNNEEFIKEVVRASGSTKIEKSGHFLEIFVEVPEITGLLPKPELKILVDIINNKDALVASAGPLNALITESEAARQELIASGLLPDASSLQTSISSKKLSATLDVKKSVNKIFETMEIISMYPKVYRYCKQNEFVGIGSTIEVEFPTDNNKIIPTMAYGIYKNVLQGFIDLDDDKTADPGEDIKRIIEDVISR